MIYQIRKYFEFDTRQATLKKEIIGGISTFLAMCYILFVNPSFMNQAINFESANENIQNSSNNIGGLFLGTAIVSFLATFLMGLISKVPLCQAPGMGLNVFFTYTVAMQFGIGYEGSLIVVMISGILYFIIAITPLRRMMMNAFSENFKIAIGTMIGLFIAYIGVANMGIIEPGLWSAPSTIGTHFNNPIIIISIVGTFLLITLHFTKVPFPIVIFALISIIMLAIAFAFGAQDTSNIFTLKDYGDLSSFGDISLGLWQGNVWESTFSNPLSYVAVLTFLFVNFFDATGTMYSVGASIGLQNEDKNKKGWSNWLTRANAVEGFTTLIAPIFLQSPVVSYVESNTGTHMGAKTGFSAIVTGLCFLLSIALWPILSVLLPISITDGKGHTLGSVQSITGPILVLVGILMIGQLRNFDWKSNYADIPMLLFTLIFGVVGFSISNGIAWGIMIFSLINIISGIFAVVKAKKNKNSENHNEKIWKIFQDSSQHKFNWVVFITSLISLAYVIVYGLIQAGVIAN